METEYCLLPFLRDLMLVIRGGIVKQVMMLKDFLQVLEHQGIFFFQFLSVCFSFLI